MMAPLGVDKNGANDDWESYLDSASGMLSAVQQGEGSTAGDVTYELTNLHGDVVGEADGDGDLLDTFDADEFGVPISGGMPDSGYGWLGGHERRAQFETGAITMGARVYLPQVGRFLQVDPVEGGSANDYEYGDQDPLNQLDLNGEKPRLTHRPVNRGVVIDGGNTSRLGWRFSRRATKKIARAVIAASVAVVSAMICRGLSKVPGFSLACAAVSGVVVDALGVRSNAQRLLKAKGLCLEVGAEARVFPPVLPHPYVRASACG